MTSTELAQFLISEYGLTRNEALFTTKLVEGKSISAASQESSMTTGEARTALNRVLLKVPGLFPFQVSRRFQASNLAKQGLREALLPRGQMAQA
jgi:hypothetical protein